MAAIRKRNTKPELAVRRFLHARGLRFRLHDGKLPGVPDLVFPSRRAVVFVHGCFWHRCPHCAAGRKEVRSNLAYWEPKLARNQSRDVRAREALEVEGWKVLTIWECEVQNETKLELLAAALQARVS
jgi:DNA mismatch endonuclease (patch repair protein)